MKVEQIYSILNTAVQETLGETAVVKEDLSNIVSIGNEIFDANAVDKYVKKLINHIGKVVYVNRQYKGFSPDIMMDSWEFGSILEKIDSDMPDTETNPSWQLTHGETYNQDKFYEPKNVRAKFFNDMTSYQIPISITEMQVKMSFSNVTQLNAFFSMIYTKIQNRITINNDNLKMRTIGNMACATAFKEYQNGNNFSSASHTRAVNLLSLWKANNSGSALTPQTCLKDLDFLKFAAYTIKMYSKRMTAMSTLFNMENRERFTATELQKIVMLEDFASAADVYLQSDTFHNEMVKLPNAETVPYWQGTGTDYSFDSISTMHYQVKADTHNVSDDTWEIKNQEVTLSGVLCCIFDRDALGVNNYNQRVPSHVNAMGEFINNFYKVDARYFNDYGENFVVFFVA